MAKNSSCNCNKSDIDALYLVYDNSNDSLVAHGIDFEDIESEITEYLENNDYSEDDVELEIYKLSENIYIEINSKPKVSVVRK